VFSRLFIVCLLLLPAISYCRAASNPPAHSVGINLKFENAELLSAAEKDQITNLLQQESAEIEDKPTPENSSAWADEAAERVREAYQDRGYFEVEVATAVLTVPKATQGDRVEIAVRLLKSGKRYRLHDVHWTHATVFSEEKLASLMPIHPGEVFGRAKIAEGLENVRKLYGSRGYINFTCVPKPSIDEEHGTITLDIDIDDGGIFILGGVVFSGLTEDQLRQALEIFAPLRGRPYNGASIENIYKQLQPILPPCADLGGEHGLQLRTDGYANTVFLFYDFEECADQWFNSKVEVDEAEKY
jgi:outer membrane translocation and assembly module TamA